MCQPLNCFKLLFNRKCLCVLSLIFCLEFLILPNSRNVRVEANIIDAITIKLPNLGVNLLSMQFRQIKDPMEIIKLAITSQGGAYLNVEELVEVAKLLGLSSQDDISAVQEAIAREAAIAGDLQLSFALCLSLAKKGHGYLDIEEQCEKLMILKEMDPPKFSTHGASVISYPPGSIQDIADLRDQSGQVDRVVNDGQEVYFEP
ncbi:hypothetical protein POM88_016551 [Heracleum sosnowskyi]|uniref:Uncharacterized protein n=1 Tax=Heracleum sosnowskyi TaxID=360622 RepID=A0AAD8INL3_9APIA|nr:hypothetical protein POM88_016551 [Heracleum sosnowskyi]